MCWAEFWDQRRPSEYLLSESRVKSEWKKTRTPLPSVLPAWEVKLTSFLFTLRLCPKSAQFCGCIKYKDNHFFKNMFYLSTFVVLAFPWTINKRKDSAQVCLPSPVLPGGQAGISAAPADLLCQGEGGAGSQGISRGSHMAWGWASIMEVFSCFLFGVWQFQVLCLSV